MAHAAIRTISDIFLTMLTASAYPDWLPCNYMASEHFHQPMKGMEKYWDKDEPYITQ